jgi:murein DD-endopeptidase MepM/ murein hydrolase activator NlpD
MVGPDDHTKGPTIGPHVLGWKRLLERWDDELFLGRLRDLDDVFNLRTVRATRIAQRFWRLPITGTVNRATYERGLRALRNKGATKPAELAADRLALDLFRKAAPRIPPARCYLYPEGVHARPGGGVKDHNARPLGNWQSDNAIDEHAPAGSPVVAIKPGVVVKLGGHDPHSGPVGPIFGEHVTVEADDGTAYFVTHLDRMVSLGERVVAGELIGRVGDWPHSDAMDHAHLGARGFNPEAIRNWPEVKLATSD